ncbi:MAG: discoidin domain-containing protein [Candidatus Aureabacteria bacterium]|nr:discoidin domain-containing protein [Candidatus Auribacterota bacterium]
MKKFNGLIRIISIFIWTFFLFAHADVSAQQNIKKTLDDFNEIHDWVESKSEKTEIELTSSQGFEDKAIRVNFDFSKRKGHVIITKDVSISLPQNYKFIFYVRGITPDNNLEFKLIDDKGNTYWKKWDNFKFSPNWQKIVLNKRNVAYGWGPGPRGDLKEIKKIEFAISCGEGGKGYIDIDELSFVGFEKKASNIKVEAKASSFEDSQHKAACAVDGNTETLWKSKSSELEWLEIGLDKPRTLTGLRLHWGKTYAKQYDILVSEDKKKWHVVYTALDSDGVVDDIYFEKIKAGFLKVSAKKRSLPYGYELYEVSIKEADEGVLTQASSSSGDAENITDGRMDTVWQSNQENKQWLEINFQTQKEIAGLFIYWGENYAQSYDVALSDDGIDWFTVYTQTKGNGGRDKIYFWETQTQRVRIKLNKSALENSFSIKEIEIKDPAEAGSLKAKYELAGQESPLGYYPRWLSKEQGYWTIVGVADDHNEALFGEDGTIEPHKQGFSIMPFLYLDNKLITREDVAVTQSLENEYLPLPLVKWDYKDITMQIKLFAYGKPGESSAYAWYNIKNDRKETVTGKLFLAIRPFQIYPPWWPCEEQGGFSPIYNIQYKNYTVEVNQKYKIFPLIKPVDFGSQPGMIQVDDLPEGDIVNVIQKGVLPPNKDLAQCPDWDPVDWDASGALEYSYTLKPGESKDYFIAIPFHDKDPHLNINMKESQISAKIKKMFQENVDFWKSKVNKIEINIPDKDMINTFKSNIAYNLITKDGPSLQPGPRNYDKAWIRDGGIVSSLFLKLGLVDEAKEFIDWYTGYQYETGEIPPIVRMKEGPEIVDEYDSQGEFIFTVFQYYVFTKDKTWLKNKLPNVVKALEYLVYLRSQRLTPEYEVTEKKVFYGILPDSISHEGYVPPVHSYWDNFWALEGWRSGVKIAQALEEDELAQWAQKEYDKLKKSVYKSIDMVIKTKNIDYVPGCVEKADYDPASTACAIIYCNELPNLPQPQTNNTFSKYYFELKKRMFTSAASRFIFGPYEIRNAAAFAYMGQKIRALDTLKYLLKHRQPIAWNQWAEVIDTGYRPPFYLGDMPHTWIGAEYLNAVRSLFVCEQNEQLILGVGIDDAWLKKGVSVKDLHTYYGDISYSLKQEKEILKARFSGDAESPPGGFVFKVSKANRVEQIMLNGQNYKNTDTDSEIKFFELPAKIDIYYKK